MELARTHGQDIPLGWAMDREGRPTTKPEAALPSGGGCSMPLGGAEETSGYKGYGLGLMVEIFCGILSGSAWGPHIRRWKVQNQVIQVVGHGLPGQVANLGQCFVALDPAAFTDSFPDRLQVLRSPSSAAPAGAAVSPA